MCTSLNIYSAHSVNVRMYIMLYNADASGIVCALCIEICISSNIAALQQAVTPSNSLLDDHNLAFLEDFECT